MPNLKFTDRGLRAIQPPAKGRVAFFEYGPSAVPGLGLRVTSRGAKSWALWYRHDGRQHCLTLGKFPSVGIADAKKSARAAIARVARGENPAVEKRIAREAPTVRDLCDEYLEYQRDRKRPRSFAEDLWMVERAIVPRLGSKKVANVTHSDVERVHKSLKETPYRANRVVAVISRMFALAEKWGYRQQHTNPARGIERYREDKRTRWLSPDELQRLLVALNESPSQDSADVVRLLLLTGARLSEVLSMTWEMVDFERGVWTKPSAHTKTKHEHHLPLSTPSLQMLIGRRKRLGDVTPFVFPGKCPGRHLSTIKTFWQAVCRRANLENVRLHDLRHTHASYLVSSGLSLPIVGQLLGHSQPATTARYAHLADDPLREAVERFGELFGAANDGRGGEIIELRGRK